MATAEHKEPNYMGVFWALLVLTLAEVGVFWLQPPKLVLVLSLVGMALAKAGLVAAYFMHLRFEKSTLALIVLSPLLLSALILIGLTPDSRFSFPRKLPTEWTLPGHEKSGSGHEGQAPEAGTAGAESSQPAAGGETSPPGDQQPPASTPPAETPPSP
jgi:cytochrome c oxidase subunit IV